MLWITHQATMFNIFKHNETTKEALKHSKYFVYIACMFVAVLVISNTTAVKMVQLGFFTVSGATIIFPLSYIFGDVLTEVYGYAASRRMIWAGFFAVILMAFCYWIVQILPGASFWTNQSAYEAILGSTPRIVFASVTAFFAGEFCNSYVLSRLKVIMKGKQLWVRTISSTIVGEGVDTILVYLIAFGGVIPLSEMWVVILSAYTLKVLIEILFTPITYFIIGKLKKLEGIDVYDTHVDYNPFKLTE